MPHNLFFCGADLGTWKVTGPHRVHVEILHTDFNYDWSLQPGGVLKIEDVPNKQSFQLNRVTRDPLPFKAGSWLVTGGDTPKVYTFTGDHVVSAAGYVGRWHIVAPNIIQLTFLPKERRGCLWGVKVIDCKTISVSGTPPLSLRYLDN